MTTTTTPRVQLALNVENLEDAIAYYSKLFGVDVNKRKPGYANFAIDNPPLKLVLFENDQAERLNHLGVETFDNADVEAAISRLEAAEIADEIEREEVCCFAKQSKVWSADPQGLRWEWYTVHEDSETFFAEAEAAASETPAAGTAACCG